MKKLLLAILVLNSLMVFAGEIGQNEMSQCPASTQSGRNVGLQKTDKEKTPVSTEQAVMVK